MKTVFIRAIEASVHEKADVIRAAVRGASALRFEVDQQAFGQVPRSPFAYWAGDAIRGCFVKHARLESRRRSARVGLQTSDDFRFVRLATEVPANSRGARWFPFAKGGAFSRFYADVYLVADWEREGHRAKAWAGSLYNGSHWSRIHPRHTSRPVPAGTSSPSPPSFAILAMSIPPRESVSRPVGTVARHR